MYAYHSYSYIQCGRNGTRRSSLLILFPILLIAVVTVSAQKNNEITTRFQSGGRQVVFTFDACESVTSACWDEKLVDIIIREKLPCIIFISGKFAEHNQDILKKLAALSYVEFGNHSYSHHEHSEKLGAEELMREIKKTDSLLSAITGRQIKYFRFPAGNYNQKALETVRLSGHTTVHWSFASGDAGKYVTAAKLMGWLKYKTKPGSILIFHINGRGYKTAEVLPQYLSWLKANKYTFVRLPDPQ